AAGWQHLWPGVDLLESRPHPATYNLRWTPTVCPPLATYRSTSDNKRAGLGWLSVLQFPAGQVGHLWPLACLKPKPVLFPTAPRWVCWAVKIPGLTAPVLKALS